MVELTAPGGVGREGEGGSWLRPWGAGRDDERPHVLPWLPQVRVLGCEEDETTEVVRSEVDCCVFVVFCCIMFLLLCCCIVVLLCCCVAVVLLLCCCVVFFGCVVVLVLHVCLECKFKL